MDVYACAVNRPNRNKVTGHCLDLPARLDRQTGAVLMRPAPIDLLTRSATKTGGGRYVNAMLSSGSRARVPAARLQSFTTYAAATCSQ